MQTLPLHNCLEGREFLLYLEGSASTPNKSRIEKHLNGCNRCFEAFISLFNDFLDEAMEQEWKPSSFERQYAKIPA